MKFKNLDKWPSQSLNYNNSTKIILKCKMTLSFFQIKKLIINNKHLDLIEII